MSQLGLFDTPAVPSSGADKQQRKATSAAPSKGADSERSDVIHAAPGMGADHDTPRASVDDRFESFCAANPHVFDEMLRLARARLARGETFISAKALWEELRTSLHTTGQPYKLDNSHTALYARALIAAEPKLAGVIKTRARKSE